MKHEVATLTGALLDQAVDKAEFGEIEYDPICIYSPSTNWSQGGPIIERERIELFLDARVWWTASHSLVSNNIRGETPLIAAMRCYVHSKFGDSVEM